MTPKRDLNYYNREHGISSLLFCRLENLSVRDYFFTNPDIL